MGLWPTTVNEKGRIPACAGMTVNVTPAKAGVPCLGITPLFSMGTTAIFMAAKNLALDFSANKQQGEMFSVPPCLCGERFAS
jgi:hypothetical protein